MLDSEQQLQYYYFNLSILKWQSDFRNILKNRVRVSMSYQHHNTKKNNQVDYLIVCFLFSNIWGGKFWTGENFLKYWKTVRVLFNAVIFYYKQYSCLFKLIHIFKFQNVFFSKHRENLFWNFTKSIFSSPNKIWKIL